MSELREYLDACYGDGVGTAIMALGTDPFLTEAGKYKHQDWTETAFAWPAEADRLEREILQAAHLGDVYLCPYPMRTTERAEGQAATHRLIHSDVDADLSLDKVHTLGGFVIASGRDGHGHVYVPLAAPVTHYQHRTLCEGLRAYLGGDNKIRDNDVLRPPGTLNYKPTMDGAEAAPVRWLVSPPLTRPLGAAEVAGILGLVLPGEDIVVSSTRVADQSVEPVPDLGEYPRVLEALRAALASDERSDHTAHIIDACIDSGFRLPEIRWTVGTVTRLARRLAQRPDDDVLNYWVKAAERRLNQQWWMHHLRSAKAEDGGQDGGDGTLGTWAPMDLGPYLRGEVTPPLPTLGMARVDGQRFIYPGLEHAVVGATESGKTWLALACAAVEMAAGRDVVYIHFEEPTPDSTIERLRLLGIGVDVIKKRLRFVAPGVKLQFTSWLDPLLDPPPVLAILDGVNEAMSLNGAEIKDVDGVSVFRRQLVTPFLRVGAATVACDHMPMTHDASRRDAYGSVHKGNALNGARLALETVEPFGRDMRGVSRLYVTKDRPGRLRAHGCPTKTPGKTYVGTLVADDSSPFDPFTLTLHYNPDKAAPTAASADVAGIVYDVIAALPDRTVESRNKLYAHLRAAGHQIRDEAARDALEDLIVAGHITETTGKHSAKGYTALASSSQDSGP